jgi:hypothetical protein
MQPESPDLFANVAALLRAEPARPAQPLPLGDRVAHRIETRILAPVEQAAPALAPVVEAVRRCGGCTQARHALGSALPHPDSGTVI